MRDSAYTKLEQPLVDAGIDLAPHPELEDCGIIADWPGKGQLNYDIQETTNWQLELQYDDGTYIEESWCGNGFHSMIVTIRQICYM